MAVLGAVLLVLALILTVGVLVSSGEPAQLDVFGTSVDAHGWSIFLTGLVTGLVVLLGLLSLVAGLRQSARRRRELRALRREHEQTVDGKTHQAGKLQEVEHNQTDRTNEAVQARETERARAPGRA